MLTEEGAKTSFENGIDISLKVASIHEDIIDILDPST